MACSILGKEEINPIINAKVMSMEHTKGKAQKDKHYMEIITDMIQEFSHYNQQSL